MGGVNIPFFQTTTGKLVEKAVLGAVVTIVLALVNDPNAIKTLVEIGVPYAVAQFVLNLARNDIPNL